MGVRGDREGSARRGRLGRRPRVATTSVAPEREHFPPAVPDDLRACRVSFAADEYVVVSFRSSVARGAAAQPQDPMLTAMERVVAGAVVAGRSNREIAEARGTSVHTVANQLAAVYRKLGIGSRAELVAAWLALVPDRGIASGHGAPQVAATAPDQDGRPIAGDGGS
ncbi:MAG: helix-turn-helix transcriptional regulator [Deltaproteobacteria bacterium]|nr:helix-turn-helix transcriptional regulator [Deltaproteobacteria bacterium]